MASISLTKRTGVRRIQFFTRARRPDGKLRRWSIRLGVETDERAQEIKAKIEQLVECKLAGNSWPPTLAHWVGSCERELYDQLADAELVPKRDKPNVTLQQFVDGYIASRTDWKPNTRSLNVRVRDDLVAFFRADTVLATITRYDADAFRRDLRQTKAESTTRKICSRAKTLFQAAVDKRLLTESPFAHMKKLAIRSAKKFTVTPEMTAKVLDACVDNQWRLIFALCRFCGLRCPSEILALRWQDVNWEQNRILVHSPKTEHHEGHESRVVPIFPELRRHLEAVWDEAADGAEFVITRYRKANCNLRTQLERTIKAAGLKPWPVLFNSLRATRDTELRDRFPDHVVNAWMGHTQKVAEKHYLQVTDGHFAAASAPLESELSAPADPKKCTSVVHTPVPGGPSRSRPRKRTRENLEEFADSSKFASIENSPRRSQLEPRIRGARFLRTQQVTSKADHRIQCVERFARSKERP
jgi:integrase